MKHYKIVKKSTYVVIAIAAFSVFFNAFFFATIQFGLVSMSRPTTAMACTSSGTNLRVELTETATTFQVNEEVRVHVGLIDKTKTEEQYKYQLFAQDVTTGTISKKASGTITPTIDGGGVEVPISMTSVGDKKIFATYNLLQDGLWCEDNAKTNVITVKIRQVDSVDSVNISINKLPEKTDQGQKVSISYTIGNGIGKKFALYISKAGTCPDETDNASCWSEKKGGSISDETLGGFYDWDTTSSETGRHGIMVKLFDADTMTDKKIAFTTICTAGTAATTCPEYNTSNDSSNNAPPDTPITVPSQIEVTNIFTSPFKMPNHITGAGDLIAVIIVVLEELLGAFAFIGIVISGIQYISSGGDSAKAEKAKKNLIYCVIGIIVAVLALTLQRIIVGFWAGPS